MYQPGLPRSKLVHDKIIKDENYCLAPLDEISLVNGVLKWIHPYALLPMSEYQIVLHWLHLAYGGVISGEQWSLREAFEELDPNKAAGSPYNFLYGSKKVDTILKVQPEDLLLDFRQYNNIALATLKDEIRLCGKDARLFVPSNIAMAMVGNWLFGAQNENILNWHNKGPIKIGLETPGREAYEFWQAFRRAPGECHQYDGAQNDAHFAPIVACLIRDFRKEYLPVEVWKDVDRYYALTYYMSCNAGGALIDLIGQQTGHTNTATDNSLESLILLMLHAVRHNITFSEFQGMFLAIMGDDIALRDPIGCFGPQELEKTWNSVGMYLECPAIVEDFSQMTFVGMHPLTRNVFGRDYHLYCYNVAKMKGSINFVRKSSSVSDRLAKLVSVCHLIFADKTEFEGLRTAIRLWVSKHQLALSEQDMELLGSLADLHQLNAYLGREPLLV